MIPEVCLDLSTQLSWRYLLKKLCANHFLPNNIAGIDEIKVFEAWPTTYYHFIRLPDLACMCWLKQNQKIDQNAISEEFSLNLVVKLLWKDTRDSMMNYTAILQCLIVFRPNGTDSKPEQLCHTFHLTLCVIYSNFMNYITDSRPRMLLSSVCCMPILCVDLMDCQISTVKGYTLSIYWTMQAMNMLIC